MGEFRYEYQGLELNVFQYATNWKTYFSKQLKNYIHGDVLEVGAGYGANTLFLQNTKCSTWTTVEPDTANYATIQKKLNGLSINTKHILGTTEHVPKDKKYDCILYIDVLEHIENDQAELERAQALLKPSGHIVVLCPAHNFLFSEFDKSIGHYRRYNKKMFRSLDASNLKLKKTFYLDSVGLILSAGNRYLLKRSHPSQSNINFWDKTIVPISQLIDPLLARTVGKSVIGVWQLKKDPA